MQIFRRVSLPGRESCSWPTTARGRRRTAVDDVIADRASLQDLIKPGSRG